ncbi:2-amino-4-hydroxy-6-hydroxymethyldihydropteridine diphosphokinase [Pararhodobacter aggregans]|uniref:2-amino-4-hydroxy-6-hydroxymethyldihydropteridine pyrophosphokinase n=1 Tax=Pararhodobacter aggregans TaxID=404875 RepID=A0A2T7US75_9RHOB|nr:2-amino-4-hydroxy-6-hydroxymethyldihydropteridine diphosphokinase [Pararhodobacter aggregans]
MHLVALGSNATEREHSNAELLKQAVAEIKAEGLATRRLSRLFSTPAFPEGAGPDFVNAALVVDSPLPPEGVLAVLHRVEARMGRVRRERWGQRVIDLDLLASGGRVLPDEAALRDWMALPLDEQMKRAPDRLILPHPRMHERGFVLVPLADVAPDWVHPLTGQSVQAMLAALDPAEIAAIRPI